MTGVKPSEAGRPEEYDKILELQKMWVNCHTAWDNQPRVEYVLHNAVNDDGWQPIGASTARWEL